MKSGTHDETPTRRKVLRRTASATDHLLTTRSQSWRDLGSNLFRNLFVTFHLVAFTVFAVPINAWPAHLIAFLAPYMRCVGLNETWDTFAPSPKSANEFLKAIVVTQSGNTEIYSFPRMEELSLMERYGDERHRKFVEGVLCKDCAGLWPDVAKEAARRVTGSADPVDHVILVRFDSAIDPVRGLVGDEAHATPTVLSEQFIRDEDLQ